MPDDETLERRLRAVERTLTDGDHDVTTLGDAAELADRVETLETDLAEARDRIVELEAATQAIRGYVGEVRSVNDDVERRADAALAAVDRLEDALEGRRAGPDGVSTAASREPGRQAGSRSGQRPGRERTQQHDGEASGICRYSAADGSADDPPATGPRSMIPGSASECETGTSESCDPDDGLVERIRDAL